MIAGARVAGTGLRRRQPTRPAAAFRAWRRIDGCDLGLSARCFGDDTSAQQSSCAETARENPIPIPRRLPAPVSPTTCLRLPTRWASSALRSSAAASAASSRSSSGGARRIASERWCCWDVSLGIRTAIASRKHRGASARSGRHASPSASYVPRSLDCRPLD